MRARIRPLGSVMKAMMRRIQNDLPCCLAGLEPTEIDKVIGEKFAAAMNSFALSPGFLEPSGKAAK